MIKVRIYSVSTDDCDVSDEVREFESYDSMFDEIIDENGVEDVHCTNIRDEQYGDTEIIIEGDVWFQKWEVIG